jgi:2-haloacid dehalogenase
MMTAKPVLVFDLGGVLVDWNPRYLYRKFFQEDEAAMERFLAEVCTPEWNAKQDEGRSLAEATETLVAGHPAEEGLIRAFYDRWPEMVGGAVEGTVEILARLKAAGYLLYALSNWSAETYPHAQRRFDFLTWFEHAVISGQIGLVKPDRAIFDHLLAKTGRAAAECIFIDDSPGNVTAARDLGFDAIHFRSPSQLAGELARREIF